MIDITTPHGFAIVAVMCGGFGLMIGLGFAMVFSQLYINQYQGAQIASLLIVAGCVLGIVPHTEQFQLLVDSLMGEEGE